MSLRSIVLIVLLLAVHAFSAADEPVFSGPQPGEDLVPFQVVMVHGADAGHEVDPIALANRKPTLLVFVHKLTRPGMALTRALTQFAKSQDGAATAIVWLSDDKAKAEEYLTRARQSLNFVAPVGISVDGGEGPGAYGLNRNVELTILIARQNRVTANFALVQPSVVDGPKIAGELAKLFGNTAPTADEFEKLAYGGGGTMARQKMQQEPSEAEPSADDLRTMMRKVIAAGATEAELHEATKAVEQWVGDDKGRQSQLGRMAGAVLERNLGSPLAQVTLKTWHEKYDKGSD